MKTNSISMAAHRVVIAVFVLLSVLCLLRPVNAHAATPLTLVTIDEESAPGVKVGTKYYRLVSIQVSEEEWDFAFQVSKSAKKGFKSLIQESQQLLPAEFVTDGKDLYYLADGKLIRYNIAKKKKVTVMTVKKAAKNTGLRISHVEGDNIYVINMYGRVDVRRIYRINVKRKTCKTLAKNVTVLDTYGYSRYNTIKEDGKRGLCSLYVLDKETGKTTLISKIVAGAPATAGGGDYPRPNDASSKYTVYIEYNKNTGKYTLMTYKFASGKVKAHKSWKWDPSTISNIRVMHDYDSLKQVSVAIDRKNGKTDYKLVKCNF